MSKKVYELTQEGVEALKVELDHLKNVQRPANLELLKEAREHGDLSENADYDAAREEQSKIETRIIEIDNILKNTKIIKTSSTDEVDIGKKVKIRYIETKKETVFRLVGTIEANPKDHKVSVESVVGKAILGKDAGDVVTIKAPNGKTYNIEILEVNNE